MQQVLNSLINKLPEDFLMFVVVFLLIAAVYFLPKIRRDKKGKLYIFSKTYDQYKEIKNLGKSINMELLKHTLFIDNPNFPIDEKILAGKKYIDLGGNGPTKKEYERLVGGIQ